MADIATDDDLKTFKASVRKQKAETKGSAEKSRDFLVRVGYLTKSGRVSSKYRQAPRS